MRISDWSSDVCSSELPIDIRAQNEAVVHLDRDVPVDAHAVAHFRAGQITGVVAEVVHMSLLSLTLCTLLEQTRPTLRVLRRHEARPVGKECVSTLRSLWSAYH